MRSPRIHQLLPLAVLVLLATAVPTNMGGWGPREGAAAWAFGAAGLGASQGVATATVYGLLSLAAISPAAPLLVAAWLRRRRRLRSGSTPGWDAKARRTRAGRRSAGAGPWPSVPTPC